MDMPMADDDTLYHYTNASGFLGIIQSETFRATNYSLLNDSSEIAYGVGVIDEMFRRLGLEGTSPSEIYLNSARSAVAQVAELSDAYVTCFSTKPDDLSQWRGYGSANDDRYCLVLSASNLQLEEEAAPRFSTNLFLAPVIYDREQQIAEAMRVALRARDETIDKPPKDWYPLNLTIELLDLAATFKDRSFQSESEWRVIFSSMELEEPTVDFTVRNGKLRPHICLHMQAKAPLPLIEIVLLPHSRPEQAIKATKLLLKKSGYRNVKVSTSNVPFVG
jgi:hypothetical protein